MVIGPHSKDNEKKLGLECSGSRGRKGKKPCMADRSKTLNQMWVALYGASQESPAK